MEQPSAITLRPAIRADARVMAVMSRELIEPGLRWRYTPARMVQLIAEPETMALVACEGPRVAGYAVMHFGNDEAHLLLLCVQASLQRRGIGRRLHDWLLASARAAGMQQVRLELRADNTAAFAFYRALGFRQTGLAEAYYDGRIAARSMSLPLAVEVR